MRPASLSRNGIVQHRRQTLLELLLAPQIQSVLLEKEWPLVKTDNTVTIGRIQSAQYLVDLNQIMGARNEPVDGEAYAEQVICTATAEWR
jgi:hypothetical protein